jgi:hypothetical protein
MLGAASASVSPAAAKDCEAWAFMCGKPENGRNPLELSGTANGEVEVMGFSGFPSLLVFTALAGLLVLQAVMGMNALA